MSERLSFENIKVGDKIPSLTKDITQVGMVMYSAATWDFARVHYDKDFVQSRRRDKPFVDGQMLGAYLAQMMMDWIGDNGTLKKMDFRFRKMLSAGDRIVCRGTVAEKSTENGRNTVKCDLWIEDTDGEKVLAPASALVEF